MVAVDKDLDVDLPGQEELHDLEQAEAELHAQELRVTVPVQVDQCVGVEAGLRPEDVVGLVELPLAAAIHVDIGGAGRIGEAPFHVRDEQVEPPVAVDVLGDARHAPGAADVVARGEKVQGEPAIGSSGEAAVVPAQVDPQLVARGEDGVGVSVAVHVSHGELGRVDEDLEVALGRDEPRVGGDEVVGTARDLEARPQVSFG
jgi:hypothetical protein